MQFESLVAYSSKKLKTTSTYNNTILDIPIQEGGDDDELVREVCKKVLEITVAGDIYEGVERDTFICNALKDYEQSFAGALAAEQGLHYKGEGHFLPFLMIYSFTLGDLL